MPAWMKWTVALLVGFAIIVVGFRWAPWLLTTFFVMNCLVLIIVVLLQSGKAADLAGCLRRCRQPDGIWPARSCQRAIAGHHLVRGDVHGMRASPGCARGPWRGIRRFDPPEILQARAGEVRTSNSGASDASAAIGAANAGSGHAEEVTLLWPRHFVSAVKASLRAPAPCSFRGARLQ